jgi:hypothetical protein
MTDCTLSLITPPLFATLVNESSNEQPVVVHLKEGGVQAPFWNPDPAGTLGKWRPLNSVSE